MANSRNTLIISNTQVVPLGHPPDDIQDVGAMGERLWREWADSHDIMYHKNDQSPETFALAFKGRTKRTDYEVRLPDLGKIAVDVKVLKFNNDHDDFILDAQEIRKQKSFQDEFKIDVWFAIIPRTGMQYRTYYWISLNTILSTIPPRQSGRSGDPFYPIKIKDCITVGWNDGLEKLLPSK